MKEVILLKYGEIILKGLNRMRFEERLLRQLRKIAERFGGAEVYSSQSTAFVSPLSDNVDMDSLLEECKKVFGIVALCRAYKLPLDFETVKQSAAALFRTKLIRGKTFKVRAKRADKSYPFTSPQIEALTGEYILDNVPGVSVDVHKPAVTVYIEVRDGCVYIHTDPEKGAGGLPVGTSGHGLLMLSGGIDSPVAGYCLAKRGMSLSAIHFESPPYTSERARQKVEKLAAKLTPYVGDINLYIVHFTEIQEQIRDKCREDLFTVIMRRFMIRIACRLADRIHAGALITGESLGQVASQTLNAICCTDAASDRPVFRPFIGTDKQEIVDLAYKIDTYDISIEPFEDCCTVFTPKHPKTSPNLAEVIKSEEKLDIENLVSSVEIEKVTI